MKKDLQAIKNSLIHRHGARELGKEEYRDIQIWVGEAEKSAEYAQRHGHSEFSDHGYYCGFYVIGKNEELLDSVNEVMFDVLHDLEMPLEDRQRARKNTLILEARGAIDRMYQTGYFA